MWTRFGTSSSAAVYLHAQAPTPRPVFRQGTDLVQVDVAVLDKKRHPVRGLTADDFTIFEDGQPRQIQAFTEVYLPDGVRAEDASWMAKVPRDVVTNRTARDEGRLVIHPARPDHSARRTDAKVLDAAAFTTAWTADHYITVPLSPLAPGEYLLKVETAMGARTTGRALRFTVK